MKHILKSCGYDIYDLNIVRGQGCYLYDDHDKRYVDFEAGVWCTALGHRHPGVNSAIKAQIDQIIHLGYRYKNTTVEEAAIAVLDIVSIPDGKCIFLSSGSEAVEFGVQCIRRISEKPLLLSLAGSYLAAYGSAGRRSLDEWCLFDWSKCTECPHDICDIECPHIKGIPFDLIGGLVFEPGNSSGLVKLPPKKLIKQLEAVIKQHHGLIMANEITTGIGRTGKWFGYQHFELQPDVISIGKSIGNGYPVSAVAMTDTIAQNLESSGFHYAQSHQNDALGCAVALKVIQTIKEENLIKRGNEMGLAFRDKLELLAKKHPCIKEVRSRGLMLAIEFNSSICCQLDTVHRTLLEKGYLVGYNPSAKLFRFYPALIIEEKDIDCMIGDLDQILIG